MKETRWAILKGPQAALFRGDCMMCLRNIQNGQSISEVGKQEYNEGVWSTTQKRYWVHTSCADRAGHLKRYPVKVRKVFYLDLDPAVAEGLTNQQVQHAINLFLSY